MDLEVLVSTQNLSDPYEFLARSRVVGNAVIVDQSAGQSRTEMLQDRPSWKLVRVNERGLSRSRNRAIAEASADILVLADDDEVFIDGYEERILGTFERLPGRDVIAFSVHYLDQLRKPPLHSAHLKRHQLMKVSSVQIAFRREAVIRAGVSFDTRFGSGAEFNMGEELIFLTDLHRLGVKMGAVPLEIANLLPGESSWFTGYHPEFFRARGASFYRADRNRFHVNALQWAIRKRSLYRAGASPARAFKWMAEGAAAARALASDEGLH